MEPPLRGKISCGRTVARWTATRGARNGYDSPVNRSADADVLQVHEKNDNSRWGHAVTKETLSA